MQRVCIPKKVGENISLNERGKGAMQVLVSEVSDVAVS